MSRSTLRTPLHRRARIAGLVSTAAVAAATLAACSSSAATTTDAAGKTTTAVNFVFDWIPTAGDVPVLAAQKFGWFTDGGITVTTKPGGPEVSGSTLVSAGQQDIGIVPVTGVLAARANGAPLISVALTQPTGPTGLVCSPNVGLDPNDPKTLDGHTIGFTNNANDAIMTKWFADNGVDASSLKRVATGADAALMFAGQVDCQPNFLTNVPLQVKEHYGKDAVVYKTSDIGAVGQSIVTNEKFLAEHKDAVQAFLTGYAKGMQWALQNVDDAVALIDASYPDYAKGQAAVELPLLEKFWVNDTDKTKGLLYFDQSTLEPTYNVIKGTEWLTKDVDLSKAYSTTALPDPAIMPVTLADETLLARGVNVADDAALTPRTGRARKVWLKARTFVQPIVATVIVLVVWQIIVRVNDVSPFIVPAPTEVVAAFTSDPSRLFVNLWTSVQEAVFGLLLAMVTGTLVGALIAYSGIARRVIYPYLVVLHITPIVAIAPLLAIWFGLGMGTKVIVTFLIAFFPLTVGAASGLRSADGEMITLMRSLNASERQVLWRVRFPAAAVPMMAGLRIAAPATVVGAVIAEFVSPDKGLGYLILQAKNSLATADLFLAIAACAVLGLVFFGLATVAERRLLHWHPSMRDE